MSKSWWFVQALHALVSSEPLPLAGSLKACAILGAFSGGLAVLDLIVGPPSTWATAEWVMTSISAGLLIGAGLSWVWPSISRAYLVLVGVFLVTAIAWYPAFMFQAMADRGHSGVNRFSHAPGVLAIGMAFGLRLLVDFGVGNEARRRKIARQAGIGGLVVGGCLDAVVLYRMMPMFF